MVSATAEAVSDTSRGAAAEEVSDATIDDPILFGWDPTPGIVSVWADAGGEAIVWRRVDDRIVRERVRFRPWVLAEGLEDLLHLGDELAVHDQPGGALVRWRVLDGGGAAGRAYRYLVSAESGHVLARALLDGASALTR
jgi:hypothetical protein